MSWFAVDTTLFKTWTDLGATSLPTSNPTPLEGLAPMRVLLRTWGVPEKTPNTPVLTPWLTLATLLNTQIGEDASAHGVAPEPLPPSRKICAVMLAPVLPPKVLS